MSRVYAGVERNQRISAAPVRRVIAARLAVWTFVVASLLALHVAPAMALSGYATDQAAVNAQYPDSGAGGSGLQSAGPAASLRSLVGVRPEVNGHSRRARRALATQRDNAQAAVRAVSAAAVIGPAQSGSIALLLGAVGVLSAGGVLRWRRRALQI